MSLSNLKVAPPAAVRGAIGRAVLDDEPRVSATLGAVTLRAPQQASASRLVGRIERAGGALLADPVGVGKTYIALAVARHCARAMVIVAPAALAGMWRRAVASCAMDTMVAAIVTHDALSRGATLPASADFVIVDESHHFRSPAIKRYAALAGGCRGARVLLLTATPVHNTAADLAAQLALFLGRRAWDLPDAELARHVVREHPGSGARSLALPRLDGPHRVALPAEDDCLDDLVALPPPVPARDESTAGALLLYGLVHQWASSRAALVDALRRRRMRGTAIAAALDAGRIPARGELALWTQSADALQLAFPELVVPERADSGAEVRALSAAVGRHLAAVDALLGRLRASADPDDARADALRRIRRAHPGERVIAFCQYAGTVNAMRARMARDAGVAALTAHGARVASGRLPRDDVLVQFGPPQWATAAERPRDRIEMLITTDLLSEGLNLQGASVIVHLDLPWNPARLDQRVGRARRLGSTHDAVTVYAFSPPASADRLLHVEDRLRDKLRVARRTVGAAPLTLPSPFGTAVPRPAPAEQAATLRQAMRRWHTSGPATYAHDDSLTRCGALAAQPAIPVAAIVADHSGFLAAVRHGAAIELLCDVGRGPTTDAGALALAVAAAEGPAVPPECAERAAATCAARAVRGIERWSDERRAAAAIDLGAAASARARQVVFSRIALALRRAPRHQLARIASLADAARAVAAAPMGEGAERILETLAAADLPDEAWLTSLAVFGRVNVGASVVRRMSDDPPDDATIGSAIGVIDATDPSTFGRIVAILLFDSRTKALQFGQRAPTMICETP